MEKFHLWFYLLMQWARKLLKIWLLAHWVYTAVGKTEQPADSWRLLEQVFCRPLQVPQTSVRNVLCPKGMSFPLLAVKQVSGEPALLPLLAQLLPSGTLLLQHGISSTVCMLRACSSKHLIAGGIQKALGRSKLRYLVFCPTVWAIIYPSSWKKATSSRTDCVTWHPHRSLLCDFGRWYGMKIHFVVDSWVLKVCELHSWEAVLSVQCHLLTGCQCNWMRGQSNSVLSWNACPPMLQSALLFAEVVTKLWCFYGSHMSCGHL